MKYPNPPPTAMHATNMNGSVSTSEIWRTAVAGRFRGVGEGGEAGSSVATESCWEQQRIGRETHEWFWINAGGYGHKA